MRTHLTKALVTRSKAIQTAVNRYNEAAIKIGKPQVDWERVSQYSFLEDFALLRETRQQIQEQPWTGVEARKMVQQYRRWQRAQEELQRLNVEVRRLHTHIIDEKSHVNTTIHTLTLADSPYSGPLRDWWAQRSATNDALLRRVYQIYALSGYSGEKGPGKRWHDPIPAVAPESGAEAQPPSDVFDRLGGVDAEDAEKDTLQDDDVLNQVNAIVEYVRHMSLV